MIDQTPLVVTGRPNPIVADWAGPLSEFIQADAAFLVVPAVILIALVDLVLRWRASTSARRLQFRWFAFGSIIVVLTLVVIIVFGQRLEAVAYGMILAFNALPIAIGIAVTRHGLYEIGRVVSRTVSYAVVTVFAVGVYALVVTSVSLLLPDQSALPVALATLVAAAAFLPALRWVQRRLDRRFDREQYDARKIMDAFGQRLRDGADPASTGPHARGDGTPP